MVLSHHSLWPRDMSLSSLSSSSRAFCAACCRFLLSFTALFAFVRISVLGKEVSLSQGKRKLAAELGAYLLGGPKVGLDVALRIRSNNLF
jgi:hypothetical protein